MSLLAAYYAGMNEENAAKTAAAYAQANLTSAQAAQVPGSADAARALQNAQTQQTQQQAGKTAADTAQVAPTAAADQALSGARTQQLNTQTQQQPLLDASTRALQGAQATNLGANTKSTLSDLPGLGGGAFGMPVQGYEKGGTVKTGKVAIQGKAPKPGPTDTVPTMLTPGEAVLNKGAVAHYGSDVIDHMNKMGLLRMGAQSEVAKAHGIPDPHAAPAAGKGGKDDGKGAKGKADDKTPPSKRAGYARGTSNVGGAATPTADVMAMFAQPRPAVVPVTTPSLYTTPVAPAAAAPIPYPLPLMGMGMP